MLKQYLYLGVNSRRERGRAVTVGRRLRYGGSVLRRRNGLWDALRLHRILLSSFGGSILPLLLNRRRQQCQTE